MWDMLSKETGTSGYIRDTYSLLDIIRKLPPLPSDVLLCTIDITTLAYQYSSCPWVSRFGILH